MGLHSRDRIGENNAGGGTSRSGRDTLGRTNPGVRWDVSASRRASSGGAMPRLGAVLLAVAVVALLTVGLHVLFQ